MAFYIFILCSKTLDRYYIGSSEDPYKRFEKHLANHKGFTGKAKDWEIRYLESFPTKTDTLIREKQLKSWKNRERIEQLIAKEITPSLPITTCVT